MFRKKSSRDPIDSRWITRYLTKQMAAYPFAIMEPEDTYGDEYRCDCRQVRPSNPNQPFERPIRMDQEASLQKEDVGIGTDSGRDQARDGFWRTGENRLIWEMPLGAKRGPLDEPGPRFVDVEGEADKAACIWERRRCVSDKTGNGSKLI